MPAKLRVRHAQSNRYIIPTTRGLPEPRALSGRQCDRKLSAAASSRSLIVDIHRQRPSPRGAYCTNLPQSSPTASADCTVSLHASESCATVRRLEEAWEVPMKTILAVVLACLVVVTPTSEPMTEGLPGGSIKDSGEPVGGTCFVMRRSPILSLASTSDMQLAVKRRYEHSLQVSLADEAISSRSAVFPWAQEAKVACGKAIGYFDGLEVNEDMISKCDCYHSRMLAHMR